MKKSVCVFLALGAIVLLGAPALGDWNVGDTYKWLQMPDLSTTGVDVNCTTHSTIGGPMRVVADDFLCTSTDPIWDVHIWGSWKNDILPKLLSGAPDPSAVSFRLSIYADIPATANRYSMPQIPRLWEYYFTPGTYSARPWATNIDEWFYDPVTGEAQFPGDHTCWQYNFDVRKLLDTQPFIQKGTRQNPIVYWLGVEAIVDDPQAEFGWKTSLDRWNDDATWQVRGTSPEWDELFYPQGHPFLGTPNGSAHMAFVITPEPSTIVLLLTGATAILLCAWRRRSRK
jgi:hypothetical protein